MTSVPALKLLNRSPWFCFIDETNYSAISDAERQRKVTKNFYNRAIVSRGTAVTYVLVRQSFNVINQLT